MKKWLLCCCLLLALPLAAQAEDEKIDPANYICAEFVAQGAVSQDPPVFQALQIDGYVSSNIGHWGCRHTPNYLLANALF